MKRQKDRKNITSLFAFLLVVVYTLQVYNYSFYLHTHKLSDGRVITHAHPYNKSEDAKPVKSHHHIDYQLITIENLEILFPVFFLVLVLLKISRKKELTDYIFSGLKPACILLHKGRSPPLS